MNNIIDISQSKSAINHYLFEIRDKRLQAHRDLFRANIKLLGTLLAQEASKYLDVYFSNGQYRKYPVIINILRAGNPFTDGVLKVYKHSNVAFYGVKRDENTLTSGIYYEQYCHCNNNIIIIPDVMLATGASMEVVINRILKYGMPEKIIVLSCISHMDGINRINKLHKDILFIVGAIDPTINDKGYIVPGLGDAGDLCYGR